MSACASRHRKRRVRTHVGPLCRDWSRGYADTHSAGLVSSCDSQSLRDSGVLRLPGYGLGGDDGRRRGVLMFAPRPDVVCWRAVELAWTHEKRIAGRTSYRTSLKRRALWSEASSPKKCPSCGLPGSANVRLQLLRAGQFCAEKSGPGTGVFDEPGPQSTVESGWPR